MSEPDYDAWVGRTREDRDTASPAAVSMMACTLSDLPGTPPPDPAPGTPLPPLWHWGLFHPAAPMDRLGPDGHPERGAFLPPITLERRMWAGGALRFHAGLAVGDEVRRQSRIARIRQVENERGEMIFVTVEHRLSGPSGLAVEERQDIVYMPMPTAFSPPKKIPAPTRCEAKLTVPMTEARLFRYSAATFNAHRIHFDLPYATGVEKYPGLVVHGPMQAMCLMALATEVAGRAPDRFSFRGVHPMFAGEDIGLCAWRGEDAPGLSLCTVAAAGHQGMQATAEWEE
ncbi:MaoC family dehydratase N-terminal domain-containing protein [Rhodosalinus sp. 5P4]|uniref:FAS1-like dehydratase domain-containing protein n=1 Tax=Rhodosalinus sp. 5P4 TaxID=3239196 RepID=UPI0035232348